MPQYNKVFNVGTYTGNGGTYRVGIPTLRRVGPSGKQAAGCLRTRSAASNYMSRTNGAPTSQTKLTFSFWLKRTALGTRNQIINADAGGGSYGYLEIYSDNTFTCGDYGAGSYASTYKFLDTTKWFNITVNFDTTLATAADRMIVYIDGKRDPGSYTGLTQNGSLYINGSGYTRQIGAFTRVGVYSDLYLSEFYFVDGQVLDYTNFTEFNSDGILVPKAWSGTFGNNGFYLPMNSSSNYVTDQSGRGNNFTPSNFNVATSNATYSLFTDSPTDYGTDTGVGAEVRGNYCTWDPNTKGSTITLDSGNLGYTVGGAAGLVCPGTIRVSSGKWFWEVTLTSGYGGIGVAKVPYTASMSYIGQDTTSWGFYSTLGKVYNNTFTGAYGTYTTNDVIGVALDADAGSITFYKNGVSLGVAFTGMTGPYIPITSVNGAGSGMANFGQRAFAYAAPSGYKAICSANIDRPADSALWFYGDTPDLMWIKNRSTTGYHVLTDTVRGMGLNLFTNSVSAEISYPGVTEINKFGMTVINDTTSIPNGSTNSHVYWGWKKGAAYGFDIQTYTSNNTSMQYINHNLGATPSFMIIKSRTSGADNWAVYHKSTGTSKYLLLNTTGAQAGAATYWAPSSTQMGIMSTGFHTGSIPCVMYLWTDIPGYSAFGSYTGNGSTDGVFVYTGFRPKWLFFKRYDTTGNWFTLDVVRNTYNVMDKELYLDQTAAEYTFTDLDILSNGFKFRTTGGDRNGNTNLFIYGAFAESPFKYARGR